GPRKMRLKAADGLLVLCGNSRLFGLPYVGWGNLGARHEGAKVSRHCPSLFQCQRPPERRHNGPPAFQDSARKLPVGSRRLPAGIGEIGGIWDVPDAPSIHAVAADAVAIVETYYHPLLFLRASHPVPSAPWLSAQFDVAHD